MNVGGRRAGADFLEGDFLSLKNRGVKFPRRLARVPAHDRARDVAKIAGQLRARKNVYDCLLYTSRCV